MTGIFLNQLEKRFDSDQIVLHPLTLEIEEGEFLVLVGPSGCGKTTTLRLIAGLEEATRGTISILGRDVTWLEPKKRGVAMVFQNYALYPHMTVLGNLMYPLNILKLNKAEKQRRIKKVAATLEIESLLDTKPAKLSGGQQQRVAIGRALVREPDIFLFDEPLSNLDARLREQMRVEIANLHRKLKRTSVYVTHDQAEAMTLGERIAVMHKGKMIQVGTPLEMYHNPQTLFVAQFLGTPPMNTISGQFNESNLFQGKFGSLYCETPPESTEKELLLGIRPENLTLVPASEKSSLSGRIEIVEHFGRETHFHVRVGKEIWLVSSRDYEAKEGENAGLVVNEDRFFWFLPGSEKRLPTKS